MGQVASRRRHHYLSVKLKKDKKKAKKNPLELWRKVKDMEISRLQEVSKETEKEFENVKRKIMCHSFLLKEIFEDTLKMQHMSVLRNYLWAGKKSLILGFFC